jgi:ubiquinone/menaquinone biosynthesis C-methylase UbiE
MPILETLRKLLQPGRRPETDAAAAYDIWAREYDNQPDNLMLALDQALCGELLSAIPLAGKTIADVGCGTGRHWAALFSRSPGRVIGYDVSTGMLDRLRSKYPDAETCRLAGASLPGLGNSSCDVVLSTLTIAHIPDLPAALAEWNRVLKPGGDLLITDYHPTALARGGQRTFQEGGRLIAVRNHVYPLSHVLSITGRLGLTEITIREQQVDESMRPWYERQDALPVYRRFLGVPIIFGLHLKKADAAQ